jgi:hypothetical protein
MLLAFLLQSVESAEPELFVGDLEIHRAGGNSSDEGEGETLSVAMDVYGFRAQ